MPTPNRVFRIAEDVYAPAKLAASTDDTVTLTDIVRLALAGYAESAKRGPEHAEAFLVALASHSEAVDARGLAIRESEHAFSTVGV